MSRRRPFVLGRHRHDEMTRVRRTDPLTDRQLEVLRWIADSCPDDIMSGHTHKSTARALEGSQLVKISKRTGAWSAAVTDIGSYYLAHGSFPSRNHAAYTSQPRPQPVRTKSGDQQRGDSSRSRIERRETARSANRAVGGVFTALVLVRDTPQAVLGLW